MAEEEKPLSVADKPAEIWIKMLVFVTTIALALVAYMGNRIIEGQDELIQSVGTLNGNMQTMDSRVSRNEEDIRALQVFHSNIRNGLKY